MGLRDGRCDDCRQDIRLTFTQAGKALALDLYDDDNGNVVVTSGPRGLLALVFRDHATAKAAYPNKATFLPHVATCSAKAPEREAAHQRALERQAEKQAAADAQGSLF